MLGEGPNREQTKEMIVKDIPVHRMGMTKDVATATLFLAFDESSHITGIKLTIDEGHFTIAGLLLKNKSNQK